MKKLWVKNNNSLIKKSIKMALWGLSAIIHRSAVVVMKGTRAIMRVFYLPYRGAKHVCLIGKNVIFSFMREVAYVIFSLVTHLEVMTSKIFRYTKAACIGIALTFWHFCIFLLKQIRGTYAATPRVISGTMSFAKAIFVKIVHCIKAVCIEMVLVFWNFSIFLFEKIRAICVAVLRNVLEFVNFVKIISMRGLRYIKSVCVKVALAPWHFCLFILRRIGAVLRSIWRIVIPIKDYFLECFLRVTRTFLRPVLIFPLTFTVAAFFGIRAYDRQVPAIEYRHNLLAIQRAKEELRRIRRQRATGNEGQAETKIIKEKRKPNTNFENFPERNVFQNGSAAALKKFVDEFFHKNEIAEILCDGSICKLKIGDKIIGNHCMLSDSGDAMIEEAIGDQIIFADTNGNRYSKSITSLIGR